MSVERTFIDTNVFVYLFDDSEPKKQTVARKRLEHEQASRELVVSTQVLQELYVALTRGKSPIASPELASRAVREVAAYTVAQVDTPLVLEAIESCTRHQISFWDALILRAAHGSGCATLLTEDLNHGQLFDGVRVESPFG
ncbi:MAG: PIN domain-containing protein [Myxococcales bacterium]|nr:PIN domain-containing protein [Myxococcales bacterium]